MGLEGVVSVWSGGVVSAKSELIAIRIFAVNLIAAFVVYVHGFLYIFPLLQLFIWLSLVSMTLDRLGGDSYGL